MFKTFWIHNKVSVYLFVTCIATIVSPCYHPVCTYDDHISLIFISFIKNYQRSEEIIRLSDRNLTIDTLVFH